METNTIINEKHKFTYINDLVDKFYKYMADSYITYSINKADYDYKCLNFIEQTDVRQVNNANKSFIEYFLFDLFYNFALLS